MKIIVCDDQAIIRDGLELLLRLEDDFQVIGKAKNGEEALNLVKRNPPDLVLMDLKMPVMNGIEATRKLRHQYPDTKVLVLTTFLDDEWLFDALRAGADGYLLKDMPRENVIEAIKGTIEGKTFIDPAIAEKLVSKVISPGLPDKYRPERQAVEKLTGRELEVLQLVAEGKTNPEIAKTLHLTEGTTRNHVSAILTKLKVNDRTQAAIFAIRNGIVD